MDKAWPKNVVNLSIPVLGAKYAFLRETNRRYVLNVALIYTVIISLSLATIIALFTEVLRRRVITTGRGAA